MTGTLTAALITILVLVIQGCTGHENPFDPENETTHGKPFNLQASPYFGRNNLEWSALNMDIDFYQIYRKKANENWSKLDSTQKTSYTDTDVVSETNYSYKITAWRDKEESDPSLIVNAQAAWYPNQSKKIDGIDLGSFEIAFSASGNRCYVVNPYWNRIKVIDVETDTQACNPIQIGEWKSPVALDFWQDEVSAKNILIVCNIGDSSLSVIEDKSFNEYEIIQSIKLKGRPLSVQISNTLRQAYVSDDQNWIIRFEPEDSVPFKLELKDSLYADGNIKRLFLLKDRSLLLGVKSEERSILIVDILKWKILHDVDVVGRPLDVTIIPNRNLAYIACESSDGEGKIEVINIETGLIESDKEIDFHNVAEGQNTPISLTYISEGLSVNDGLLFIASWSRKGSTQATRVFGYHIGPENKERVDLKMISSDRPELIRIVGGWWRKKLYVLDFGGFHSYYENKVR